MFWAQEVVTKKMLAPRRVERLRKFRWFKFDKVKLR